MESHASRTGEVTSNSRHLLFLFALQRCGDGSTVSAYSPASSMAEVSDLGSEHYAQWLGSNAAACINPACLMAAPVNAMQHCYDACTAVNECAGVRVPDYQQWHCTDCKLIMAVVQPGASKRTLAPSHGLCHISNATELQHWFQKSG